MQVLQQFMRRLKRSFAENDSKEVLLDKLSSYLISEEGKRKALDSLNVDTYKKMYID